MEIKGVNARTVAATDRMEIDWVQGQIYGVQSYKGMNLTINQLHKDRLTVSFVYFGNVITWEVLLDLRSPNHPPDFIIDDGSNKMFTRYNNIKKMVSWNPENSNSLLDIILELIQQFKEYQFARVRSICDDGFLFTLEILKSANLNEQFYVPPTKGVLSDKEVKILLPIAFPQSFKDQFIPNTNENSQDPNYDDKKDLAILLSNIDCDLHVTYKFYGEGSNYRHSSHPDQALSQPPRLVQAIGVVQVLYFYFTSNSFSPKKQQFFF